MLPINEKKLILVLAGSHFCHIVDFMIMMPLGPQIVTDFGVDTSSFGLLISAYTYSGAFSAIAVALILDRIPRRTVFLVIFSAFIVSAIACAASQSYGQLLLARILTGAFGGVMGAVIHTLSGDFIPFERRGKAAGLILSAFSIASVLGVPLSLGIANLVGWRASFLFISLLGAILFVYAFSLVPTAVSHRSDQGVDGKASTSPMTGLNEYLNSFFSMFSQPNVLRSFALSMTVLFTSFIFIPYITLHLVNNIGVSSSSIPFVYLFGGAATFFTSRLLGAAADRYGKLETFRWVCLVSIVPLVLLPNLGPHSLLIVLLVTTIFFVFVSGRMVPLSASLISVTRPEYRGRFMAVNSSAQQIAMGTAAWLGGLILQGVENGYFLVSVISVMTTILAIVLSHKIQLMDKTG